MVYWLIFNFPFNQPHLYEGYFTVQIKLIKIYLYLLKTNTFIIGLWLKTTEKVLYCNQSSFDVFTVKTTPLRKAFQQRKHLHRKTILQVTKIKSSSTCTLK